MKDLDICTRLGRRTSLVTIAVSGLAVLLMAQGCADADDSNESMGGTGGTGGAGGMAGGSTESTDASGRQERADDFDDCRTTDASNPGCEVCTGSLKEFCDEPDFCYLSKPACSDNSTQTEEIGCGFYRTIGIDREGREEIEVTEIGIATDEGSGPVIIGELVYLSVTETESCQSGWEVGKEPACDDWQPACDGKKLSGMSGEGAR